MKLLLSLIVTFSFIFAYAEINHEDPNLNPIGKMTTDCFSNSTTDTDNPCKKNISNTPRQSNLGQKGSTLTQDTDGKTGTVN